MEKLVSNRLKWYLETNNLLSPLQSGFRPFRSTQDHLVNIDTEICNAFSQNHHVILVSLDIEKAYEMISKSRLLIILQKMKITGNMLAFINNFLIKRYIKVRCNDCTSSKLELENGLPQGSVISVILFLIAINEVSTVIKPPIKLFLFADDITLLCTGKNLKLTIQLMQRALNQLTSWAKDSGFIISKNKSEFIIFSRNQKILQSTVHLMIDNQQLKRTNICKILGIYFDEKHSWKYHINTLKANCYARLNILKTLSSLKWGADTYILINIYKSIIQPKIDYGSIVYSSAKPTLLQKLDPIINSACRLSLGAFRSSPVTSLLAEAGLLPLELRRKLNCLKFSYSTFISPSNPTNKYIFEPFNQQGYNKFPSLPKSLCIRISKYISEFSIDPPLLYQKRLNPIPPWSSFTPSINLDFTNIPHSDLPSSAIFSYFSSIQDKFINNQFFSQTVQNKKVALEVL